MKRFVVALVCWALFAAVAPAQTHDDRLAALEKQVAALTAAVDRVLGAQQPQQVVVPAGSHAHVTTDGRTIIHSNANLGSAAAHVGIAPPWIRTAEAGQTVTMGANATQSTFTRQGPFVSTSHTVQSAGGCPPGGCPTGRQYVFTPFGGRFRR